MGRNLNIEIKARVDDLEQIRRFLLERGADFKGEDHQIDTYFAISSGRLKIREGNIENCIVHYDRPDQQGPKLCDYSIVKSSPGNPELLVVKSVLAKLFGVLAVVEKNREIYFIDNVKFHLDVVKNLGSFFEIEVISDGQADEDRMREICETYLAEIGIDTKLLVNSSYSDMIILQ